MGAVPGPLREEPRVIFDNNVSSTFNVMTSAAELGLRRVVFSSSAFGMGWVHDGNAFVPLYLPLDEEHPMMPFEPYGLSKQVGEDIGRMVARSSDTSVVSLRFTNVALPDVQAEFPWPVPTPENPLTLVMWAYADARDVAEAHVLALDAEIAEYEAFMIAQPSSRFEEPTIDLVRNNFGDHVEIREGLEGVGASFSNVVEFTTYVVGQDSVQGFIEGRTEVFPTIFPDGDYPPNTLLVIGGLVREEFLVEVSAVAALP